MDIYETEVRPKHWIIDTRGTTFTLVKENTAWAKSFETMEAAVMFALDEIREGR